LRPTAQITTVAIDYTPNDCFTACLQPLVQLPAASNFEGHAYMAFVGASLRGSFMGGMSGGTSQLMRGVSAHTNSFQALAAAQMVMQRRAFRATAALRAPERVMRGVQLETPAIAQGDDHRAATRRIKSIIASRYRRRMADPANSNTEPLETLGVRDRTLRMMRALPKDAPFLQSSEDDMPSGEKRVYASAGSIVNADGQRPKKGAKDPHGGIDTTFDDRGHLVPEKGVVDAHKDEVNQPSNVVAENRTINQRYKKAIEDAVKNVANDQGSKMELFSEPHYDGDKQRPTHISHYVTSGGTVIGGWKFPNPASKL